MTLNLGWFGRRLFEGALRRLLEKARAANYAQGRLPVTIFFQLGSIKGRVIVDEA